MKSNICLTGNSCRIVQNNHFKDELVCSTRERVILLRKPAD